MNRRLVWLALPAILALSIATWALVPAPPPIDPERHPHDRRARPDPRLDDPYFGDETLAELPGGADEAADVDPVDGEASSSTARFGRASDLPVDGDPANEDGTEGGTGARAAAEVAGGRARGEPPPRGPHLDLLKSILESGDKEALRRFLVTMTPSVLGEAEAKLLIEHLGTTNDRGLIAGILGQVRRVGGTAVTEALASAIGEDTSPRLAQGILQTLGRMNTEASIAAIVSTLEDPDRAKHQVAAFRALAAAKNPAAIPAISERLNDENGKIRREAADALAKIGTNDGWDGLLHYAGRGPVQDRARGRSLVWRYMRSRSAVPILADALSREPDARLRATVAKTIAARRDPRAYEPLVAAARDDAHPSVRREAILSLARLGDRRAIAELDSIARTETNGWVRRATAAAIRALERKR